MSEPFYKLLQNIAGRKDLTPSAKMVHAALMFRIADNGKAWPGVRRLARDCGIGKTAATEALALLESEGLLNVERRKNGQSNLYRIPQSVPESGTVSDARGHKNRTGKRSPGVPESGTLPYRKTVHNRIEPLKERGAAAPPAPSCPKIIAQWIDLYSKHVGRDFPPSGKGQLAGTVRNMLKGGIAADDLERYVRNWFAVARKDYGVALFKAQVEGGNRDLVGRGDAQDYNDPLAIFNGQQLAQEANKA